MRLASIALALTAVAAAPAAAAQRPAVLMIQNVNGHLRYTPELMADLYAEGFNVRFLNSWGWPDRDRHYARWIPKAHVVVMLGAAKAAGDGVLDKADRRYFELLRTFVHNGGGLLYMHGERYSNAVAGWVHFQKQWGLSGSVERVYAKHYQRRTVWGLSFAYTDRIAPSPVTEGVGGIWYPVYDDRRVYSNLHGALSGAYPCQAMTFTDPAWQVVVRGSADSWSVPTSREAPLAVIRDNARPEGYASRPPLVGIREFGRGRVAFSGISSAYFFGYAATRALEGITWTEGIGGKPSDGRRLFLNTLRWLAEPALQADGKRGFEHDKSLEIERDVPEPLAPLDWSKQQFTPQRSLEGLVGARTAYSTGRGTVADWKAAARKAGLDFLVFLEAFEALDRDELAALRKDCAELSDATIRLVPGFASVNAIGMKNYYASPNLPYPKADMLAPDGKTWGLGVPYSKVKAPGQLNLLRQAYVWTMCGTKVMLGYYDFQHMPVPYQDCGIYDTVPVLTARDDRLVENALHVYRDACRDKQFPQVLGLHFLSRPEQLAQTDLVTTRVFLPDLAAFDTWFDAGQGSRFLTPPTSWATQGPEIVAWDRLGGKDYSLRNPDAYVWQNALSKVRLHVRSDAGLADVRLWDGDDLFRHWRPAGDRFEQQIAVDKRDQQRELILEVVDRRGRRAVGGRFLTKNHFMQQVNCGDRNNQLANAFVPRRGGSRLKIAQIPATPNKRVGRMAEQLPAVFTSDEQLGLDAFDGNPRYAGFPSLSHCVRLRVKGAWHRYDHKVTQGPWGEEANGSHHVASCAFASMDALVGDRRVDRIFADQVPVILVWYTLWRLQPREFSTWWHRRWVFRSRGDEPLLLSLWQCRVTLKKDIAYEDGYPLGLVGLEMNPGGSRFWSLGPAGQSLEPLAQGSFERGTKPGKDGRMPPTADFGTGAWAAYTGGPGGGELVMSLTPGLTVAPHTKSRTRPRFEIGIARDAAPTKAGQEVAFDVLTVAIPRHVKGRTDRVGTPDPAAVARALKAGLGVGRKPGYEVAWTRGTPTPAEALCKVRATDGAVVGRFEKAPDLVVPVPVLVEGLNPNWTVQLLERSTGKTRPLGRFEGVTPVVIDPQPAAREVFVGHPVVCDVPGLVIHVVQVGDARWSVELHNPTEQPIAAHVTTDPDWPLFKLDRRVGVPAGASQTVEVP